jgi:hypothetical protein
MRRNQNLETKVLCLRQIFRPEKTGFKPVNGQGYCPTCEQDKYNKRCSMYVPVTLSILRGVYE